MPSHDLLEAALIGYQAQLTRIEEAMAEIRRELSGKAPVASPTATKPARRKMSAAGRRRIAEGQRKRWAEHNSLKAAPAPAKVKRRMTPARRAALAANVAKARAARAAKRATA